MSLKSYISPEFQWMAVSLIEDTLSASMNDYPEIGDDEEDIFGDEEDGGEDPIGGVVGGEDDFNWDNW